MANLNKIQATINESPSGDLSLLAVNGTQIQQVPISAIKTNSDNSSSGLAYTLSNDETYYIVSGIGECTDTDIKIPPVHKGLPVKEIGSSAFMLCKSVISIVIPDSVTSIGGSAFQACSNLNSIAIPNSVTSIGQQAFYRCVSLIRITIPDSVTSMGISAFGYCDNLTNVVILNSVTSIGHHAFSNCYSLTSVVIGDNVTSIGQGAFGFCNSLSSVVIGNGVTSIGKQAFASCDSLTRVMIPDSVTSIDESAFSNCTSLTIYCEAEAQPKGWDFNWNVDNRPVIWGVALDVIDINNQLLETKSNINTLTEELNSLPYMTSITYSELKSLRDNSELIPGMFYRITDYICTTSQENTRAMDNKFDIIVQALSSNTLSETAKADYHYEDGEPDGYFQKGGSGQTLNITWVCSLGAGGYEGNNSIIFGELGSEENNEGEVVPVLYKMLVDEETGETTIDYEDRLFYIGSYEFEGETYDRWRFIETGSAEEGCHTWDSDDKKFILTNTVVENNEFIVSNVSEVSVAYTMYDDDNGSYIENSKGDTFVETSYGENNEGVIVPILYKTALDSFPEPDYEDTFYYVGQYEYAGETYDRWRKIEPDLGWDDSDRIYALTNIVIENNQFIDGVVESSKSRGGANLPAWELKYCLDNDTTRFAWANGDEPTFICLYDEQPLYPGCELKRCPEMDNKHNQSYPYAWCAQGHDGDIDVRSYVWTETEELASNIGVYWYRSYGIDDDGWRENIIKDSGDFELFYTNRGVIYYMKDEHGNECPYDFKNIQFKRDTAWQEEHRSFVEDSLCLSVGDVEWFYTFSWVNENLEVEDLTMRQDLVNDEGAIEGTYHNAIDIKTSYVDSESRRIELSYNVFINTYQYEGGVYYGCYNNTFGNYCYNNTFGNYCYNNTFSNDCYNNTFSNDCYNNTFGNYCCNNTFGNYCYNNTFGNNCTYNTFSNSCYNNIFDNNCNVNTFGNSCNSNTFGNSCGNNKMQVDNSRYVYVLSGINNKTLTPVPNTDYQQIYKLSGTQEIILD